MAVKKTYFITCNRFKFNGNSTTTVYKGTIDEFINNVFGYTLEVGNSWNKKVNRYPKTIKSLISNLNKAAEASCRFYQDRFYELSTEDEIKKFNESKYADTNICTIS